MTNPFLRNAEHCMGKVADAPASPVSKCVSSISVAMAEFFFFLFAGDECIKLTKEWMKNDKKFMSGRSNWSK